MVSVLSWWLIMQVLGLAALPLAWRIFRNLPDRGYAFARPLGLLLAGYVALAGRHQRHPDQPARHHCA